MFFFYFIYYFFVLRELKPMKETFLFIKIKIGGKRKVEHIEII